MKNKTRVARLTTTNPTQFIDVEVLYAKGGINYFTYVNEKRGYWLSIQPVIIKGDGFISFTAFSGSKVFLEEAKRFSQKKLEELAAQATAIPQYKELLEHVLAKNQLKLWERAVA